MPIRCFSSIMLPQTMELFSPSPILPDFKGERLSYLPMNRKVKKMRQCACRF